MSGDDRGPRESPDSQGNGWLLIPALFFGPSTWSGVAEALRVIALDAVVLPLPVDVRGAVEVRIVAFV